MHSKTFLSMKNFIKSLFCKNKNKKIIKDNLFNLSIHVDRENEEHVDNMNMFIDMLKIKEIKWITFTPTTPSIFDNNPRYYPFCVSVDLKDKNTILEIHEKIYGF